MKKKAVIITAICLAGALVGLAAALCVYTAPTSGGADEQPVQRAPAGNVEAVGSPAPTDPPPSETIPAGEAEGGQGGTTLEYPSDEEPEASLAPEVAALMNSNGSIGTLSIPAIDVNVQIFEGTDAATLDKGAGHFGNASVWTGNVPIAGHNRGANCYFGDLHKLKEGDEIVYTTRLGTRTYAVTGFTKVLYTDLSGLAATEENTITLYTCVRGESDYRWCVKGVEIV